MLAMPLPILLIGAATWHSVFCLASFLPSFADSSSSRARGVSTLYGVLVVLLVLSAVFDPHASPSAESGRGLFAVAAGYYLWALSFTLYERGPATLASLHHFCCFLCYGLSLDQELYPVLMRSGHIFLLAEASTTCINLRYLAFRAGREQQAKCWEVLFIVSFVATRVLIGIPLSASWWLHDLPRIRTSTVASLYMASNLAWNAMNVLTVWRIFLAYWRHGALRSPSSAAAAGSKQLQVQGTNPRKAELASKAGPAADKIMSIQLPPSSAPCIADDEVACQLTVSSALDCHMDLWLLSAPAQSGSSVAGPGPDATAMQSQGQRPELAGRRGWAEGAGGSERRIGVASRRLEQPTRLLTRIHGKWYDLRDFKHPGGPVALSLAGGRDATALFESHHPLTPRDKLQDILAKYLLPDQEDAATAAALQGMIDKSDDGAHYVWNNKDAFEEELKAEVRRYFEGEVR